MEFTLFYKGKVYSPGARQRGTTVQTVDRVDPIRLEFHKQLKELWDLPPLCRHKDWRNNRKSKLRQKVNGNDFVWLVTKRLDMYAQLDIQVLIHSKDRTFRDIDNKLKTVCDALRKPRGSELANGYQPKKGESSFFCLLEDDEAVYQIAVDTDFLLCKHKDSKFKLENDESMWIINVKLKGNRFHQQYMDLLV
jgi:hypothetical protein